MGDLHVVFGNVCQRRANAYYYFPRYCFCKKRSTSELSLSTEEAVELSL